ncbi:MAG: AarF/UbiB family protein [Actinomycetota bacterium]
MAEGMGKVAVATDRSESAERAVRWAATLANRYSAPLLLIQVVAPQNPGTTQAGAAEATQTTSMADDLRLHARDLAGPLGDARVVADDDAARAIVRIADEEAVDTLVLGNAGMGDRKKFLLGNVPNRVSHNARCNVVIVNTTRLDAGGMPIPVAPGAVEAEPEPVEPRMFGRAADIGKVMAKHGIKHLFVRERGEPEATRRAQAKNLRAALEELGPTFAKLGQVLSTRPDLLPPEFIQELAQLQDDVPPLSEEEVVGAMEQALGVPWEDVFETIDPKPLAAGTIAQVHRATLADGERVVIKIQRPTAREDIMRDLALLELFAEKAEHRPALKQVVDLPAVTEHLSESLQRELDFRQEAANIDRMRGILVDFPRLDVPGVHEELSGQTLLVMQEIGGVPIREAPESEATKDAARQMLESYYRQILTEGFFHADPHPGNLKWWEDRIYFLDFGMVGELGTDTRENLMLLLLAFWQQDVAFLTDITLSIAGAGDRADVDVEGFRTALGDLTAHYRNLSLRELQLGQILQEMTEISIKYDVPLPASLTLTGKAMAQMQLATAELDPELDPFEVAGAYMFRNVLGDLRGKLDAQKIFYTSRKMKVRLSRLVEAFERLTGARPGPKLQVNFRAESLEATVARAGRLLATAVVAGAALLGAAFAGTAARIPGWIPIALGVTGGAFVLLLLRELFRGRQR